MLCQTIANKTFTTYEGVIIEKGTPMIHRKESEGLICILVDTDFGYAEYAVITDWGKAKKAYNL